MCMQSFLGGVKAISGKIKKRTFIEITEFLHIKCHSDLYFSLLWVMGICTVLSST